MATNVGLKSLQIVTHKNQWRICFVCLRILQDKRMFYRIQTFREHKNVS